MMKSGHLSWLTLLAALLAAGAMLLSGQNRDIFDVITKGGQPSIAVIDFRGAGQAQQFMNAFNRTLWDDLDDSGAFEMRAKTNYPLLVPQQPSDFQPPVQIPASKPGQPPVETRTGPWLTDWSGPPVQATYLAFGYAAEAAGTLVLNGYFFNVQQPTVQQAQIFANRYAGDLSEAGAVKVAHQFAADILRYMGIPSLAGSRIFFISDRSGFNELWVMDYDGSNQRQFTDYKSSVGDPAVSPDGKLVAFRLLVKDNTGEHWEIRIHSTETGRRQTYVRPPAPTVVSPSFSADGQRLYYSVNMGAEGLQIISTDLKGGDARRHSYVKAIEVSPSINPKNNTDMLFISGRSGRQQLWRMTVDGANPEMLTNNEGDVGDPVWSPDGYHAAFIWTRGYDIGGFNIFVMDVPTRQYVQLTHGNGANEDPTWAPDGLHLAYSNTQRNPRSKHIYTMLANGTKVKKLTSQGNNFQPVWAKAIN